MPRYRAVVFHEGKPAQSKPRDFEALDDQDMLKKISRWKIWREYEPCNGEDTPDYLVLRIWLLDSNDAYDGQVFATFLRPAVRKTAVV